MSKRSGLSRWQDLKRWYIDIGRYRYILHRFDMEPWLDKTCPICEQGFTEDPRYKFDGIDFHWECATGPKFEAWESEHYEKVYGWEDQHDTTYIPADCE